MEPGALNVDTRYGTLTVNSILLAQSWIAVSDPKMLLDLAELRGANKLVPHTPGTLGRRRRRTETRKDFPIAITGLYDRTGARVALADRYMQLIDHMEYLDANLGVGESAPAGISGTVTALWTRPDSSTKTASVHVMTPLRLDIHSFIAVGTLSLSLPNGRFA